MRQRAGVSAEEKRLEAKVREGKRHDKRQGRPRCFCCGRYNDLQEIERNVPDGKGGFETKKVLYCGRC
jgi:hypothetical protein